MNEFGRLPKRRMAARRRPRPSPCGSSTLSRRQVSQRSSRIPTFSRFVDRSSTGCPSWTRGSSSLPSISPRLCVVGRPSHAPVLDSCGLRRPPYRRPPRRSRPCRRTTSRRSHVSALRRKLFATARPTNAPRTLTTGWIECCCLSVCVISPSCLRDLPVFHLLLTRNALQRYGLLVLSHALPYLCAFSSVISLSLYISCLILSVSCASPCHREAATRPLSVSASPPFLHRRESSETILLFIDSGGSEVGLVKLEFKGFI